MAFSDDPTGAFYDDLAPLYKFIYVDWEESVDEQAKWLDGMIKQSFKGNIHSILDAACGIGTQLIGLSKLGYQLTGADISQRELDIAMEELQKNNITVDLHHCGFKDLTSCFRGKMFDLVIAIDNAIPHLLTDAKVLEAFAAMYRVSRKGALISVRDYDRVDKSKMKMVPFGYRQVNGKLLFLFQRWEFKEEIVSVSFFFIEENNTGRMSPVNGRVYRTKFYAIGIDKLMDLLNKEGFENIECIMNGYLQPVIIGKK